MRLLAALALFVLAGVVPAEATFVTAAELLSTCRSFTGGTVYNNEEERLCHGYVMGVHDAAQSYKTLRGTAPLYCEPARVTSDEMIFVVKRHLLENPELLQYSASSTVLGAFARGFPCETPAPPGATDQ